jgi:4-hydroxy-2-oxoheptanedioate aldolase
MRENAVKRGALAGRAQIGSLISTSDPVNAQIMANSGFEWVMVDMEHGPVPLAALQTAVAVIRTTSTEPFVRVAWNTSAAIQTALDCGVSGIMIPMIDTREQAEAAVRDARYGPLGERSRGGILPGFSFATDSATYRERANDEVLMIAQIETVDAIRNLDGIAAVEGLDCLFVGPYDLAATYGVHAQRTWADKTSAYFQAIAAVPARAREHGKIPGIQAADPAMANECVALGFTVIGVGGDASLLHAAARRTRQAVITGDTG